MKRRSVFLWCTWACIAAVRAVTLEECVAVALQANPSIEAVRLRLDAAERAVEQAHSAYWPRAYAAGSYSRTDNPAQAFMMSINQRSIDMGPGFDPNRPDDTQNMRATLGVTYRLLDGGIRSAAEAAAMALRDGQTASLTAARNQLVFDVVQGYYQTLRALAFENVRREAMSSLATSLKVARDRFDAGAAVKTDVLNLEVQLAQAEEDVIRAENAVTLALLGLNTLIGRELVTRAAFPATTIPLQPDLSPCEEDCTPTRGEQAHIDAVAVAAAAALRKTRAERRPTLDAMLSTDWDTENGGNPENSYTAMVGLRWDVFTGGEHSARQRRAEAEWKQAQAEGIAVANRITLDVNQARVGFSEAAKRVEVAAKALLSAEESLQMTRDQYRQGVRTLPELVLAESGLTASRARHVTAYFDLETARANVMRALGNIEAHYHP